MLQKWMGHADIATTAIYADAMGEEEQEIAARMSAYPRRSCWRASLASASSEAGYRWRSVCQIKRPQGYGGQLEMQCERCNRHGRLSLAKLMAEHGRDTRLPDLADMLLCLREAPVVQSA